MKISQNQFSTQAEFDAAVQQLQRDGWSTEGSRWTAPDDFTLVVERSKFLPSKTEMSIFALVAFIVTIIAVSLALGRTAFTPADYYHLSYTASAIFVLVWGGMWLTRAQISQYHIVDDVILNILAAGCFGYALLLVTSVTPYQLSTPFTVFPGNALVVKYDDSLPVVEGVSYTDSETTFSAPDSTHLMWRMYGEKTFSLLTTLPPQDAAGSVAEVIEVVGMRGDKQVSNITVLRKTRATPIATVEEAPDELIPIRSNEGAVPPPPSAEAGGTGGFPASSFAPPLPSPFVREKGTDEGTSVPESEPTPADGEGDSSPEPQPNPAEVGANFGPQSDSSKIPLMTPEDFGASAAPKKN